VEGQIAMSQESTVDIKKQILERIAPSQDLHAQEISNGHFKMILIYITSICDSVIIQQSIIDPYMSIDDEEKYKLILDANIQAKPPTREVNKLIELMLQGHIIILLSETINVIQLIQAFNNTPVKTKIEATIYGPSNGLSESLETNISITRQLYPSALLQIDRRSLGAKSQTSLAILYDKSIVNEEVLEQFIQKLDQVKVDMVQGLGHLQRIISKKRTSLFPTIMITERPDRIALNISQGKIVILMQGTGFALIAPAVFYDFFSAMDDVNDSYWVSMGLVILRYVSLMITITLPAIYIMVVSFNPEILRVQFTFSIAGSRMSLPYPSYIEVLIMLFLIEALTEASIRLPPFIGATATTVGGLILGQAAQQAGLVSSIMIIVTSSVAIANYVIPITTMTFSVRLFKYPLIIFTSFFGLVGLASGLFALVVYLASLRSFGQPYLRIFMGENSTTGIKPREELK
jgi:spore germination protein KA